MRKNENPPQSPWLDEHQAANYLGVSHSELAKKRRAGVGPKHSKLGARTIRYHTDSLDDHARKFSSK
jgi:predicted DNA-binding transcriptional regulator AlpA